MKPLGPGSNLGVNEEVRISSPAPAPGEQNQCFRHNGVNIKACRSFIHSRLDDARLNPFEFRIYGHFLRRADPDRCYPGLSSIVRTCEISRSQVIRSLKVLERRRFIHVERNGRKSNLYTLLPADEWCPPDTGAQQALVPQGTLYSAPEAPEGNPTKAIQTSPSEPEARKSGNGSKPKGTPKKKARSTITPPSEEGFRFADWFRTTLPDKVHLQSTWRASWARCYDDLLRIDKRTKKDVFKVCKWARQDDFWSANFQTPLKLRTRDKSKVNYFDFFTARMVAPVPTNVPGGALPAHALAENLSDPPDWIEFLTAHDKPYVPYASYDANIRKGVYGEWKAGKGRK